MRVLVAGAYGQGNPGDEALLAAVRSALDGHEVVATSRYPAGTVEQHGCEAVDGSRPAAVARAAASADAVVFGGGTVFKTLHPDTGRRPSALLRNAALLASGARVLRRPLAVVGVGAAEIRRPAARAYARAVARCADLLVVRDEASARLLREVGAEGAVVGADLAWTVLPEDRPRRDAPADTGAAAGGAPPDLRAPAGDRVVVALSHLAGSSDLPARLVAALRPLARRWRLELQPWQVGLDRRDDLTLLRLLTERLPGAVGVPRPRDLGDAVGRLAGARALVGMRFHSCVTAAAAGIPFVAVDHEPKLGELARRLGQPSVRLDGAPEALALAVERSVPPDRDAVDRERDRARRVLEQLRDHLGVEPRVPEEVGPWRS